MDFCQFAVKLTLDALVVFTCPRPERSLQPVFHPVDNDFANSTLFLVTVSRVFEPGVEASSHLLLHHAAHVVGHDLF